MDVKEKNCNDCNQAKEAFFELNKFLHTANERYTNIVCGLGYVSFVTILMNCHEAFINFSKYSLLCIYVLLTTSIFVFVAHEIWKIKIMGNYTNAQASNLKKFLTEEITISYHDLFYLNEGLYLEHLQSLAINSIWFFRISSGLAVIAFVMFLILSVIYFIKY